MESPKLILVVEDEPAVSDLIKSALEKEEFAVTGAATGSEALAAISTLNPNLVLLDLMLPDMDGLNLLATFKAKDLPVLVLTARGGWEEKVKGLNLGADDYLAKPFQVEELTARVKAILRRTDGSKSLVQTGDLTVDLRSRLVTLGGRKLFLSTTEFALLELLAGSLDEPVSRQEILKRVWDDQARDTNVVEVYINYLRNKLERSGRPRLIITIRGKGYLLRSVPQD